MFDLNATISAISANDNTSLKLIEFRCIELIWSSVRNEQTDDNAVNRIVGYSNTKVARIMGALAFK